MWIAARVAVVAVALVGCSKSKDGSPEPAKGSAGSTHVAPVEPKPAAKFATSEAKLARYLECWDAFNAGKDDVYGGCFAADAVREQVDSIPELVAQGGEKIVDMAKAQRTAFPDLKVTPQLVVVSGNDILAILHVGGTNTGDAAGMKTTGKKLGVFEAEIATMAPDGTLTHDSLFVDQPTMFYQLGLLDNDTSPKALAARVPKPETLVSKGDAHEAANKKLIETNLEAVNKKDPKPIAAVAADDIKLTYHGDKQKIETKKAYLAWLDETLRSTKDGFVDIKGLWTAGDYVIVSDTFTGTPSEEVVGKDAEPRRIETHVVQFFRIKDGKLAEQQIFANRLKAAVQLGIVDPDELMKTLAKKANK